MQRYVAQHKRDAHRKQHLRQVVFSGSANEEAIDQIAERDDSEPAAEYAKREASGVAGDRQSDVAPDKIIGAVRHVHDAHQPEGDRETAGEQKQERGEGNAVDRLKDAAVHKTLDVAMAAAHAPGGCREAPSVRGGLPLVRSALQELLRRPGPELRHVFISLDRNVDQYRSNHGVIDLLNARHVDVLDWVVIFVHLERAARGLDRCSAHRFEESVLVLNVALDRLYRSARPKTRSVGGLGEP